MSSPKRTNHAFGKGPQNSFMEFQSKTDDAWDPGDDEWMTSVVSLKAQANKTKQHQRLIAVAHSTAQEVIEKHSEQQRRLKQQPGEHAAGDEESNGSRVKSGRGSIGGGGPKAAPGVGVRLNSSPRGLNSLYRRGTNNDKPQKKEKCQKILAGPITSLDELRSIAWSGIPSDLRAVVWKLLSDFLPPDVDRRAAVLEEKRKQYENYLKQYYPMRTQEGNSSMFKQIQKDLVRMSILHDKKRMQEMFERILFIWSMRHPASGYVQGINDLLTPFFVVFLSEHAKIELNGAGELSVQEPEPADSALDWVEADCFWCVSRLLDTIQDNYTFAQPGIQQNVLGMEKLIERMDLELHRHLASNDVQYLQFAFRWMNNLLMRELPLRCIIRLWDTYLAEKDGFSHFHLYVAVAFLLRFSNDLKRERDFQGLMMLLQNLPTFHWTDEDITMLLAEAYRLQSMFAGAPNHLDRRK